MAVIETPFCYRPPFSMPPGWTTVKMQRETPTIASGALLSQMKLVHVGSFFFTKGHYTEMKDLLKSIV